MNDEAKKIKNKLINAKNIYNVIENLKKQNYDILYGENLEEKFFTIKKNNINVSIYFIDTPENEYKQNIKCILY